MLKHQHFEVISEDDGKNADDKIRVICILIVFLVKIITSYLVEA